MRVNKIKYKIRNGLMENHEYGYFNKNQIFIRVQSGERIAKMNFTTIASEITEILPFYVGLTAGRLTTDIHALNADVSIEIQEIA